MECIELRFVEDGLMQTLEDKPSEQEYKRKSDGDLKARLLALSYSKALECYSSWSLRMLVDKLVELEYIDYFYHETIH